ncbi:dicarboxylate/amino acid:cation symporter [Chengkuizengella axinellae]|uniref:Dicarboxylate/amino acid:cation symporter n=1 Tax=Chengkuizengella axinellae TaxID=3064388 RepID=A0ABT9J1I6_9BACL|nr:dicarboxylate/amino acid:cation symporter [Chengkuizengella sp. 2205SS18-9]MDP5275481.1 dicarboxylate/amino acid:cation symporter [Chengkuizengella sp. 2205SS18-9]
MSLTKKILIGMALGIFVGLIFNFLIPDWFGVADRYILYPVSQIFLGLIKLLVVPIVIISIVLGTAGISDPKKLGRIGIKTVVFFLITTSIALVIAISVGNILQPGMVEGIEPDPNAAIEEKEAPDVVETLIDIVPTNIFLSMTEGKMLQIIFFSIFFGFALAQLQGKVPTIKKVFDEANSILMFLVEVVMKLAPYGAFALIAIAIGEAGIDAIRAMGNYFVAVLLALFLHLVIIYGSVISFLGKMNPFTFVKKFFPAITVAFSTSSSSATLPVSMDTAQKNLKIPKSISGFVQPLGATINMDGTAIMQGVATVFVAQLYGVDLSISDLAMIVLTATLASIGTAGVPGVGIIMLTMVLTSVGLSTEAIGLLLGVDRLLDMTRTAVNITGDAACAQFITKSEEKHERKAVETA